MPRPESGTDRQRGGSGSRFGSGGVTLALPDRGPAGRSAREQLVEGSALGSYLQLVNYMAGLYREGKATLSARWPKSSTASGAVPTRGMLDSRQMRRRSLLGRFFATTRQRLRDVAQRLGLKRVANLGGSPAP